MPLIEEIFFKKEVETFFEKVDKVHFLKVKPNKNV